jgi:hypothetical protein
LHGRVSGRERFNRTVTAAAAAAVALAQLVISACVQSPEEAECTRTELLYVMTRTALTVSHHAAPSKLRASRMLIRREEVYCISERLICPSQNTSVEVPFPYDPGGKGQIESDATRQRRPSSDHTDQIFSSIRFEPYILLPMIYIFFCMYRHSNTTFDIDCHCIYSIF